MQKTLIYIDRFTKSLITPTGLPIERVAEYPTIERGQWQVLCVQFVDKMTTEDGVITLEKSDLSTTSSTASSFVFMADNNFDDNDSLMLKSLMSPLTFDEDDPKTNRFNIRGDWYDGTTADLAQGQLSIRVNSDTVKFTTVLNSQQQVSYGTYACIKQYEDLEKPSTIAWFPFVAINTIRDENTATEVPPTGPQIGTYVSAALKNPIEFQFSVNGTTGWHSTQTENDMYYRQRVSNLDSEWSAAIMLPSARGEASNIVISDESDFYTGMSVEAALQQIGATLNGLESELEDI